MLIKSSHPNNIDTAATYYAWKGNKEKANSLVAKGAKETPKRVQLLLSGKTPKEVEEIISNESE